MKKISAVKKYLPIFVLLVCGVLFTTNIDKLLTTSEINTRFGKSLIKGKKYHEDCPCKSFVELPENWKPSESWNVGFKEAPKCPDKELIIIVNTGYDNTKNRAILRSFFKEMEKRKINFAYFFLLGKSEAHIETHKSDEYIVGDFEDTYDNLILKTKTSYEYFEKNCKKAKYYLLMDDDVTFSPSKIMKKLAEEESQNTIFGKEWKTGGDGTKAHDHWWLKEKGITITLDQWEKEYWPDYIAGPFAFMTAETARIMAKTAANTKKAQTIPIEDVAFNGILREKACVGVQNEEDLAIHLNKDTHALEKSLKEMINELTDHRVIKPYENLPVEKKFQIDCAAIAKEEQNMNKLLGIKLQLARAERKIVSSSWVDQEIMNFLHFSTCEKFISERNYVTHSLSKEEEDFPLAYSFVVHRDAGQVERLLRAVYRPQNVYCIHIDKKADAAFYEALKNVADCFPNVFLSSKREDVIYATYSMLQAHMNCMDELLQHEIKWRYLINLCGQDFPLKTNREIVTRLRSDYPHNHIESMALDKLIDPAGQKMLRYTMHHDEMAEPTDTKKADPPMNMQIFGGSTFLVATREFINWALHDETIKQVFEWSKDTWAPEEMVWASIIRINGAPGFVRPNKKWDTNELQSLARFVKWEYFEDRDDDEEVYTKCHGFHQRGTCVFGAGDVGQLLQQRHFFANKFDANYDDFAVQCLEKILRDREVAEVYSAK